MVTRALGSSGECARTALWLLGLLLELLADWTRVEGRRVQLGKRHVRRSHDLFCSRFLVEGQVCVQRAGDID